MQFRDHRSRRIPRCDRPHPDRFRQRRVGPVLELHAYAVSIQSPESVPDTTSAALLIQFERVLAQPQRRVQRTTLAAPRETQNVEAVTRRAPLAAVRSIVGLCVDKTVVLTVGADPEPVDAILARQAESTIMNADSGTVELTAAEKLELQGRVRRVAFQQLEVLVGECPNLRRKRVEATPEPRRRRAVHRARGEWFL